MPSTFRSTWFFGQGNYGWSETWFHSKDNHQQVLSVVENVRPYRKQILVAGANLRAVRISDDSIFRDSLLKPYSAKDQEGQDVVGDADFPFVSVLCRAESSALLRRQLWLRGIPDPLTISVGAQPNIDHWLGGPFDTWANQVMANEFALKVLIRPPIALNGAVVNVILGGPSSVVTNAVNLPLTGDKVRIKGLVGVTGMTGIFQVGTVNLTTKTFELIGAFGTGTYRGGGTWVRQEFTTAPITALKAVRIASRRTGRPFDSPRGRRRRVRA